MEIPGKNPQTNQQHIVIINSKNNRTKNLIAKIKNIMKKLKSIFAICLFVFAISSCEKAFNSYTCMHNSISKRWK